MIDCYVYTKKIAEIKVPHSIYELFIYEDSFDFTDTNIYYGMYQLHKLKEDIEETEYSLTKEEEQFIYNVYEFCKNLFENENVDEVRFLDEEF